MGKDNSIIDFFLRDILKTSVAGISLGRLANAHRLFFMKRTDSKIYLLFILLFAFGPHKGLCQDAKLTHALNAIIQPITTIHSEDSFQDIDFLRAETKDASIIGIGESTHGTRIYDVYRQRLVRFLVQQMGYKAIIDEGGILAAEKLDAFINNQTDSLEFMGGLQPVVTNKKELDWLRSFNKNKSEQDRVHIYGAEVKGFYGIVQKIKGFYLPTEIDPALEKITGDVGVGYKNLTKNDFEQIKALAEKLKEKCTRPLCSYYLSLLNQQIDFAWRLRFGRNGFEARDGYMFENIKSIISKTAENKVIILAHNGHLQKTKFGKLTSLGYLLNGFYGHKYFVIATDFNVGSAHIYDLKSGRYESRFWGEVNRKDAIEYYLKHCKYPDFFLPVSKALKNPITARLVTDKIYMLRDMGSTGDIIKHRISIAKNYDLLAFFNNANDEKTSTNLNP